MSLPDHVVVSITSTTVTLARQNFGIVGVAAYLGSTPPFTDRVRTYTSLGAAVSDGIVSTNVNTAAAYYALAAAFAQQPAVQKVKLLRLTTAPTVLYTLTITDATEGKVYSGEVNGKAWTYTVLASATTSTVATAIAALISGLSGVGGAAVAAGAVITFTPTVTSARIRFRNLSSGITFAETTADPSIAADLAAIAAIDNDWFGLTLAGCGKAEILAASGWLAAQVKVGLFTSCDSNVFDNAVTTDVASQGKAGNYTRAGVMMSSDNFSGAGAAWMSRSLAMDPGTGTWKFKNLLGVVVDGWTESQSSVAKGKNANLFTRDGGQPVAQEGVFFSGGFVDFQVFVDWLKNEMTLRVFGTMAGSNGIPYSNEGRDVIVGVVKGVLAQGAKRNALSEDYVVTATDVNDIDPTVRGTRVYDGIAWNARYQGFFHKVTISGTVGT